MLSAHSCTCWLAGSGLGDRPSQVRVGTFCFSVSAMDLSLLWNTLPLRFKVAYGRDDGDTPSCEVLAFLFEDEDDLRDMLTPFVGDADSAEFAGARRMLLDLQKRARLLCGRLHKRRALVPVATQRSKAKAPCILRALPSESGFSLAWLASKSGAIRRRAWRTRADKRLAQVKDGAMRADIEREELQRWRSELASLVREAKLPAADFADLAQHPDAILEAAIGSVRASTIRKRVREWKKFRAYCQASSRSVWPSHVGIVLDYLLERRMEPCARTVPCAILSCLAFLEKAGSVPHGQRLSELPIIRNTVNQMTMELETGAPPKRQAPFLPLTMICALELLVTDVSAELFVRGFAFYKLLKIWTACRSDDLTSLNPGSLRMVHSGLLGTLERTKTSGPGKRVRFLPIFVSRKAYIVSENWLTVGWEIWNRPAMCFERDYFLPRPRKDWAGVQRVMASYPETVVLSKSLWRSLRRPMMMESNWQLSHDFLLDTGDAVSFWTEHSERNWLVSVLTFLETPRDQRDFVGRWSVPSSSDDYVRTARLLVMKLQERAVRGLLAPENHELRESGIDELLLFLERRGFSSEELDIQKEKLKLALPDVAREELQPVAVVEEEEAAGPPAPVQEGDDSLSDDPPFFIAVVGKNRLRRLHRRGGCGTTPADLCEMIPLEDLQGAEYHVACKHCWRRGAQPEVTDGQCSASSGSTSSSTESGADISSDG